MAETGINSGARRLRVGSESAVVVLLQISMTRVLEQIIPGTEILVLLVWRFPVKLVECGRDPIVGRSLLADRVLLVV